MHRYGSMSGNINCSRFILTGHKQWLLSRHGSLSRRACRAGSLSAVARGADLLNKCVRACNGRRMASETRALLLFWFFSFACFRTCRHDKFEGFTDYVYETQLLRRESIEGP